MALVCEARQISIHAPLTGCDIWQIVSEDLPDLFQPTHPSRGATGWAYRQNMEVLISTHAPLTGCDSETDMRSCQRRDFNPRTPHGVRPNGPEATEQAVEFQPTHPSRGATIGDTVELQNLWISTHAPLTGCDLLRRQMRRRRPEFQPTHPSRGATGVLCDLYHKKTISTHAPLTGCDRFGCVSRLTLWHFNPRTPHGVRQIPYGILFPDKKFQPTHPSRGATRLSAVPLAGDSISTHAPLTGCDAHARDSGTAGSDISTHAPLTGCDRKNCRFEQQFLRLGSREAGSVRPSANQTGTAQKFIFCVPSAVRGGREFPDRFPFARFRSLRPSAGR